MNSIHEKICNKITELRYLSQFVHKVKGKEKN